MSIKKDEFCIQVFQTAKDTNDLLSPKDPLFFAPDTKEVEERVINVYDDVEYQEIIGFGGAFTESAAVTFYKMSSDKRQEILDAYFNPIIGLGYSFCRTHINSCDFSLSNYAYVEDPDDVALDTFSIKRDQQALIPFIKEAMSVEGSDFKLFGSPWSPPAWMKTNGEMNHGGKLIDEHQDTWARYFTKYLEAYAEEGINIWGVTVQNEAKATQKWDSCVYTAWDEKEFVKNHLGPVLENKGLGHVKIMIWDHNKERVFERARIAFEDIDASKYIWGISFHWYSGDHFEALEAVNHKWPDKKLVFTEGCTGWKADRGDWNVGEKYGHDILGDLKHHTCAWTDWNLILNEFGGPRSHVPNYCNAPIIADTVKNVVNYEISYYYIGHFSKFIRPGSIRIACTNFTDQLETVAFKTPENKIVIIVMNRTKNAITSNLRYNGMVTEVVSLPHSIMTLVFEIK